MPRAIVLPMRLDDYGRVVSSSLPERVWADRVRTVINTTVGERAMRPDYGSRIPYGLMESIAELPQLVEDAVRVAFVRFLPTLTLISARVIEEFGAEASLEITYSIPGNSEPQSVLTPYGGAEVNV